MVMDTSSPDNARSLVDLALNEYGRLDSLVNNAGIDAPPGNAWDLTDEEWQRTIDVNLSGLFYCSKAALRPMLAVGKGAIVNISSQSARHGRKGGSPAYNATKAGGLGTYCCSIRPGGREGRPSERYNARPGVVPGFWIFGGRASNQGERNATGLGPASGHRGCGEVFGRLLCSLGFRHRSANSRRIDWVIAPLKAESDNPFTAPDLALCAVDRARIPAVLRPPLFLLWPPGS